MTHPLDTRPERVALVALGPSSSNYHLSQSKKKGVTVFDEVWTVNSTYLAADKIWVMDDLRRVERRYPDWALRLRDSKTPIITCHGYPEYPESIEYPLAAVVDHLKDDYFSVTPAYMVAYAIHIGVRELWVYGCDFFYPGNVAVESGAACMAYWLGIARERRMSYKIPHDSTLLDCHLTQVVDDKAGKRYLYGYDYNPGESYDRIGTGQATELDHKVAVGGKIHTIPKEPKDAKPKATQDGK